MKEYKINGKTRSIAGWAKLCGITRQAMSNRILKAGDDPEKLKEAVAEGPRPGFRSDLHTATEDSE